MEKTKKGKAQWYFLIFVIIIYIILFFINAGYFNKSLSFFIEMLKKIIPSFFIVFVFMIFINYFVTPKLIAKHFKEKSIRKWFFAVIGGIISTGPPFLWYPLLKEAKEKGVSYGIIACFIYVRSIKIPYIPILILYFGIKYTLILSFLIIIMSVIHGIIINKILEEK